MSHLEAVEAALRTEFGALLGDGPVDPSQDLLASGVLDSFGLIGLIDTLERTFSIDVVDEDVVPENFRSLAQLAAFVEAKQKLRSDGGPPADRTGA